jgi:hypothetical protein
MPRGEIYESVSLAESSIYDYDTKTESIMLAIENDQDAAASWRLEYLKC